ncbi:hypothetical protein SJR98_07465 [Aeromonas hydrophila]|uniref:hypothetical protein n=1 Tax=Aeromonas hydrophila TaxID=644 RepID=UPI0029D89387|nr:hypothetical protein [Aeromonas hydrophila]MDX7777916.1 hypothetical protein [Aeromonas hydrophila]
MNFNIINKSVSDALGIVYGWAAISSENGVDYFDTDNQHIPAAVLEGAALEFAEGDRVMSVQHDGAEFGKVVFALPLLRDNTNALGLKVENNREGLIIGVKPNSSALAAVKDGTLRGFSIGGRAAWQDVAKMRFDGKTTPQRATLLKLLEISLVDIPAQTGCEIAIVKNVAGIDAHEFLQKQRTRAGDMLDELAKVHGGMVAALKTEAGHDLYRIAHSTSRAGIA